MTAEELRRRARAAFRAGRLSIPALEEILTMIEAMEAGDE